MSLWRLFERSVRLYGDKTALVQHDTRISFLELQELSSHMALRMMTEIGRREQQKIFILSRNSIEMVAVMLGCFQSNQIACPVNWRLSAKELAALIRGRGYGLFVCDRENEPLLARARCLAQEEQTPVLILEDMSQASWVQAGRNWEMPESKAEDGAIQLFTSGSTGTPKAAYHSNAGLEAYIYAYAMESRWTQEDIYQTSANLFHMSGLSILVSLMIGCTTVIFSRFELMEFLTILERERTTRVSLIPTLIVRLIHEERFSQFSFASVKKVIYAGAPMNHAAVVQATEKFHCQLEQAYGATESCCISVLCPEDHCACGRDELNDQVLASVGRPLPSVQLRIRDGQTNEEGYLCGEIEVKSPYLCLGHESLTEDGYHPTGDIGYLDEDGYLYLVGRKHDMIICGGENIYPKEVEDCLCTLKDDVAQVCVLGMPHKYWGEIVVACVVKTAGSDITEEQLITYCKQHIASYKKPKQVVFCDSLPENANGKVSRILLRQYLDELGVINTRT